MGHTKKELQTSRVGFTPAPGRKVYMPNVDGDGVHISRTVKPAMGQENLCDRTRLGEHSSGHMSIGEGPTLGKQPKAKAHGNVEVHGAMHHQSSGAHMQSVTPTQVASAMANAVNLEAKPSSPDPLGKVFDTPKPSWGAKGRIVVPYEELTALGEAILRDGASHDHGNPRRYRK